MDPSNVAAALTAARSVAAEHGLAVDDVTVLHNSNRVTARLHPCNVVARICPLQARAAAALEVAVAAALGEMDAPIAPPDPRVEPHVFVADAFAVTLWTYCRPLSAVIVDPREYADALSRLHASMRDLQLLGSPVGRFTDRVTQALRAVEDPASSLDVSNADRALVATTLRHASRAVLDSAAPEQLLHGEPHPGNVIRTAAGLVFIDLETCCRGPVEFDIAHATIVEGAPPIEVAGEYVGADVDLVRECWRLTVALATAWRFEPGDDLPDGEARALEWIRQLRRDADRG